MLVINFFLINKYFTGISNKNYDLSIFFFPISTNFVLNKKIYQKIKSMNIMRQYGKHYLIFINIFSKGSTHLLIVHLIIVPSYQLNYFESFDLKLVVKLFIRFLKLRLEEQRAHYLRLEIGQFKYFNRQLLTLMQIAE